ncbi:MarR family winged helix-turn-helix transcriptional regulator [Sulfitobacter pacificus]|uniref:Transcriptional regulator n=1 Tax=Sulfitobacter pacificus TaxID=1499314 RepID=A0ABQ5VHR6_9RHOB|nr:MarR family transcriptional regulator [Sulfitobacter pacificus]GLQ26622.1 transcriptional regulator [Sulfitobacter pacificus]
MSGDETDDYVLDDQIGFLLRLASQRHSVIFQRNVVGNLTPTQFSTLVRISERGGVSQNHLGRLAAMDVATIKGVVDRLKAKGLVQTRADLKDKRRMSISLTDAGHQMMDDLKRAGHKISALTLDPLSEAESQTLVTLLRKIS